MPRPESVQEILDAFVGLFNQPFEQDLKPALKAATTAILLATLPGSRLLIAGGNQTAVEFFFSSFVLVLVWMLFTAVFAKQGKTLTMARNLSVLSFWIGATLVVVFLVDVVRPDPLDRALRRGIAAVLLIGLIPVHMCRNLPVGSALKMTLPLWISTIFLAWIAL